MKPVAYATALLGLVSFALGQAETPGPSPTESIGCEPHGDHWHCEGPRPTSAAVVTTSAVDVPTTTSLALVTSTASHDEDDHDHDDDDEEHTDAAGTASLAPSPTDSVGCEPHGDHWHCDGPATPTVTGTAAPSFVTTTTSSPAGNASTTSTTQSVSTAAAARYEVVGLGFAGLAAVAAMAL